MEPQCKLPDGKMRADHVFDEDGPCDCSARKMEFAPRPPLRPEMVRLIADLERKRDQVNRCIAAAREIEQWWGR